MSTPLRTGAALDMIHFDGREVARYVVTSEHVMSAKGSREAFGRGKSISMRSVSVRVWVDAPLTTRVTLNMMHFDGREVGRSAKNFEVPHVSSTHILSAAKGSRDASLRVESTRAWRFCGCVRVWVRHSWPCNARDNAFGCASRRWRAPESCARCLAGMLPLRAPFACKVIPRCLWAC